jgi:predicted nuclease with TOPRIM domain
VTDEVPQKEEFLISLGLRQADSMSNRVKGRKGMTYDVQLIIAGGVVGFASSALMAILVNFLSSRRQMRQWKRREEQRILDWKREDLVRKYEELKKEEEKLIGSIKEKDAEIDRLAEEEERLLAENKQLRESILDKL